MSRKILVVEDDRDISRNMHQLLTMEGYGVELATNGQEALAVLRGGGEKPCLIILDLMMPIMDGFQFREEQKKVPEFADIPVVIMTADGHLEEKKSRADATAALKKPCDIDVIVSTINSICPIA